MEFLPLEKSKDSGKISKKRTKAVKIKSAEKLKKATEKKVLKKKKKVVKSVNDKVDEVKENSNQNEKIDYRQSRLFVFMKKKIANETMVKELHPDIVSVRFPRKKRSRWCWALFESEKKAQAALRKLKTKGDVVVRESFTKGKMDFSSKKKLQKTSKKEMKKMLKQSWT